MNLNLEKYSWIILDCDGVILNSNFIKEENIRKATIKNIKDEGEAHRFTNEFIKNSGVPREIKTHLFFNNPELEAAILTDYNLLNRESLCKAELVDGVESFIQRVSNEKKIKMMVLSGADKRELEIVLSSYGLADNFEYMLGGPKTKLENLASISLEGKVLFFGDSLEDYKVADVKSFDFIFVYEYTHFTSWKNYFENHPITYIKNFKELNYD